MIFDATTAESDLLERRFDACVIGAGPAGITLARRLAAQGLTVALMEAGGLELTADSQDLYAGEITGLDYYPLDVARLRYFGGTSNHWGGWCRELDAYDFRPHPYAAFSGWPIAKSDLDPYQGEADAILDLAPPPGWPDLPIAPTATTSATCCSASAARRRASARSTRARSKPPTASACSSTPTSSICASATTPAPSSGA